MRRESIEEAEELAREVWVRLRPYDTQARRDIARVALAALLTRLSWGDHPSFDRAEVKLAQQLAPKL